MIIFAKQLRWIYIIFMCLTLIGCENSSNKIKRVKLTYFVNKNNFAGRIIKEPYVNTKEGYKGSIFYTINGHSYIFEVPAFPYGATLCPALNEIIIPTTVGILAMPIGKESYRWIFKEDDILLKNILAFDNKRQKLLLSGIEVSSMKYFLIALDIVNCHQKKFNISTPPTRMLFTDDDSAVASSGSDLIWANFSKDGEHQFMIKKIVSYKGSIRDIFNCNMVFYLENYIISKDENDESSKLIFEEIEIGFDYGLCYVTSDKSNLWALSNYGHVFIVNSDGVKTQLDNIDKDIIGWGNTDGGFWVATDDGCVRTYKDSSDIMMVYLNQLIQINEIKNGT